LIEGYCCPGCAGATGTPRLATGSRQIVACAHCGLLSTSPRLTDQNAREKYSRQYYSTDRAARFTLPIAETVMRRFRRHRANALARQLGGASGKRILDVGCGRGYTLRCLQQLGADVFGTQMSAPAARAAAALVGRDRVFIGELEEATYPEASFDAVTLWHVLEHVARPCDVLTEVARILTPDGLVYVEVPNAGGWSARTLGADWLAWDVEHHVSHFSPETLAALARRAGLERVREQHLSLEYSPVTLMQTWLNRTLGGHNRLFRAVTFSATAEPDDDGRVPVAVHALAGAALLPVAVAASLWLARRGAGDTVGVYFRKPRTA